MSETIYFEPNQDLTRVSILLFVGLFNLTSIERRIHHTLDRGQFLQ